MSAEGKWNDFWWERSSTSSNLCEEFLGVKESWNRSCVTGNAETWLYYRQDQSVWVLQARPERVGAIGKTRACGCYRQAQEFEFYPESCAASSEIFKQGIAIIRFAFFRSTTPAAGWRMDWRERDWRQWNQ